MKLKNPLFTSVSSQGSTSVKSELSCYMHACHLLCSLSLIIATQVRELSKCSAPGQGFWGWEHHLHWGQSTFPFSCPFHKYLLMTYWSFLIAIVATNIHTNAWILSNLTQNYPWENILCIFSAFLHKRHCIYMHTRAWAHTKGRCLSLLVCYPSWILGT